MTTATAYATAGPKEPFAKTTIERREPGPHDVRIKIAFAGICHSDIHTAREEWGGTHYPLVPGHEIAGTVEAVGEQVEKFTVGDRVGVGCMVNSCGECENCRAGNEQHCLVHTVETYNSQDTDESWTDGGYSTHIVVDENFVLNIPEGVELDVAAPLLCAGITLYSPLTRFGAGPGKQVAIIGLGGLGHVGVKIAHALGAEVTVLSQTLNKKDDGLRLGADHYYATSDDDTWDALAGHFDLIVNTVSAQLPMDKYLSLLKLDGTLVNVGAPSEPLEVPVFALLTNDRTWAGSKIGGIAKTQEMLDFCAEHHIGAEIEKITGDDIDDAYDRVVGSDVRYRFVIDVSSFER